MIFKALPKIPEDILDKATHLDKAACSTNIESTNKKVRNIHIHAKLRMAVRDKGNIKAASTHKELASR